MITTDSEGLTAGEVQIPTRDGQIPAYRAMPAGKTGLATVLVVQEIFGVHEHIKDVTRRLAKQGYLAVAPELYVRQGDPTKYTDTGALINDIVAKVPDAQVMADLDATAAFAAKDGRGDPARLAATGFCWGGRIVWLYAAHSPKLRAGAAWYGRLEGAADPLHPRHPLELAGALKAPVLGLYGGADAGIPNESVERMRAALKAAGSRSEIVVYPEAPHGFHADYRPSYREADAKDGWQRMLRWFAQHGAA
jgi:carboxymethylenebutenolidase